MKTLSTILLTTVISASFAGGATYYYLSSHQSMQSSSAQTNTKANKEPLYWVAPMDANYKRDKPGKSPMGMDLVPVYEEGNAAQENPAGTVMISPAVENNLGVKTTPVIKAKLSPNIDTVGYIAFDESRLWQTNVRVSGWVQKLNINAVGEKVRKGEVLFTLYSPELVKAQEELLNAYRTGRSGLIKGATERLVTLGVDRPQIAQIVKTKKVVNSVEVKAVNDGIIASLNIREGGYLSPSQAVISAGPIDEVWVDAEVFERQGHWIKAGTKANMTLDAIPGKAWEGRVDYVYPILDPKTRTLRVRLKFKNDDNNLKPNMFANIILQPETQEEVLTIPRESVIRSGAMTRVVLAKGDGKFRSARIEVGREAGNKVEVIAGLTTKDTVVTSAQFMLDSESSQNADLSRINGVDAVSDFVWTKGEITKVMTDHKMLTISHQPIKAWDWPGMTMNFTVADKLNMADFSQGEAIEFKIEKQADDSYLITEFKPASKAPQEAWVTGTISSLMADFGMITIKHEAVDEWQWKAGEMNFMVDPTIKLNGLEVGQRIRFLIGKKEGELTLSKIDSSQSMNHEKGVH